MASGVDGRFMVSQENRLLERGPVLEASILKSPISFLIRLRVGVIPGGIIIISQNRRRRVRRVKLRFNGAPLLQSRTIMWTEIRRKKW